MPGAASRPTRPRRGLEFGLLALAITASGAIIWGVIQLAFPGGAALHSLAERPAETAEPTASPPRIAERPAAPTVDFAGVIASLHRIVQVRAGTELAWAAATVGRAVQAQDAIQTMSSASALIRVKDQGDIRIGENSLVVFQANTDDPLLAGRRVVAAVDHGELAGSLKADADADAVGIRLPHGVMRVQGERPGQAADFHLQVNQDKSAEVLILRGRSQVRTAKGTHTLHSGEGIRISADGRLVETQSIPPVPEAVSPVADQLIAYQKDRPQVAFRWRSAASVDDYRFLLAEDRDFKRTLVDVRVADASYTPAAFKSGEYFWKVSSRRGWLESPASPVARIRVERDMDARVREALATLYAQAGDAKALAEKAQGVLVFPNVVKGGLIVGGEYGEGALLSHGRVVDYYTLKSASLGLQLGGQTRKVFLLFMTPEVLDGFVHSTGWKAGVDGSIALATLGAARTVNSAISGKPIIAFVLASRGLMGNLTLEGSRISRTPD